MTAGLVVTDECDDQVAARLWGRLFPNRPIDQARIDWQYRRGFCPGISPLIAIVEGSPVGHAGVIPVNVRGSAGDQTAIWFVDFALLSEWQRRGVGGKLAARWNQLGPLRLTTCNEKSMALFAKQGWIRSGAVTRYALPLTRRALSKRSSLATAVPAFALRSLARFRHRRNANVRDVPATLVLRELEERFSGCEDDLIRDQSWFRWRVAESPHRDEYRFAQCGAAWALYRLLVTPAGIRRLHILYVSPADEDVVETRRVLDSILHAAIAARTDLVWAVGSKESVRRRFATILPVHKEVLFASHSDSVTEGTVDPRRLNIQGIDSDLDTAHF
jgi:hypothetical protein